MSQRDYYAILDECISRIRQGESLRACLADYPTQARQLAPDLALTAELIQLPLLEPTPQGVAAGYERMMAALDDQDRTSPLASLSVFMDRLVVGFTQQQRGLAALALRAAAVIVVLLIVAGGFVVTAAAGSLPGDTLYPVKRTWENARLTLTINDTSREVLRSEFAKRRREEVRAVQELRRPVAVEFSGIVESMAGHVWQVDGLDVIITGDTQINGVVSVDQRVSVRAAVKADGSLIALAVTIEGTRPAPPEATAASTSQPTRSTLSPGSVMTTPSSIAPTPTSPPVDTRPEPMLTGEGVGEATSTVRPTPEPTWTRAPSVDVKATPTPLPTNTPSTDSLATSRPRPTATPAKDEPTPTATSRTVDVAPPTPTPTPTSRASRDLVAGPTPTATRAVDTGDWLERPP